MSIRIIDALCRKHAGLCAIWKRSNGVRSGLPEP